MRKPAVSFDDLFLVPSKSDLRSRHEIDLTPRQPACLGRLFTSPLMASCMDTVVNSGVANTMRSLGSTAVLHRYVPIVGQVKEFTGVTDKVGVFCAIGATGDFLERFNALYAAGCRLFCIDVAHGHHQNVWNAVRALKSSHGDIAVMAGNVATLEGFNFLADAGADFVRVGVAGGAACETRNRTGFGLPTLESVLRCAESDRDVVLVADGGFRDSGDIVKALACGADMVMLGSMLAAHRESPGETVLDGEKCYKKFRGMASESAQLEWRGWVSVAEGKEVLLPLKTCFLYETVDTILRGIRSGLSYAGCQTLAEFALSVDKQFV